MTKAMRDADCWTDHCLIISKLDLHIQPKRGPQGQKVTNRVNVTKLKNTETVNDLQSAMNRKLSNLPTPSNDIEEVLASFTDTVHSTALEVLGPTTRNHKDWLDESMYCWRKSADYFESTGTTPPAQRSRLSSSTCAARYRQGSALCRTPGSVPKQTRLRAIQTGMTPSGFTMPLTPSTYGPQSSGSSFVLRPDGTTLLTEKKQILERWAEHFDSVLNRPSTINDAAIQHLPQAGEPGTRLSPKD